MTKGPAMFNPRDPAAFRDALTAYRDMRPLYEILSDYLQERLRAIARQLDIYPMISGRAKSLESFAEKIQREKKTMVDPLRDLTDLCGVRVITHTLDEVDSFADAARKEFEIDEKNIEDTEQRLGLGEFGYLSKHFTIQLREPPPGLSAEQQASVMACRAELQVRTLAQHVWAALYHEMGYKNEFALPPRWKREFARMAAQLESCDHGFQRVKDAIRTYESASGTWGAYLPVDQLNRLAGRLKALLEVMGPQDPGRVAVVHRLIRTYLSLGVREELRELLTAWSSSLGSFLPALRDAGIASCKVYGPDADEYRAGQDMLRQVIARSPGDVDALCSLGGTLKRQHNRAGALHCYREAHLTDPTNPYPLGNYIAEELLQQGDTSVLRYFRVVIDGAAARCRNHIDAGVNFPWSLFDLGLFHLYLEEPVSALAYYARGIETSTEPWMIDTADATIQALSERITLNGLTWVHKLLTLGTWARTTRWALPAQPLRPDLFKRPLLILAGGCRGLEAALYRTQLDTLRDALGGFKGTLVSGGTRSGVAALAGDLQAAAPAAGGDLATIGYLPGNVGNEQIDYRYTLERRTDGADFSVLEPLTFWDDVAAAGCDPRDVRLIGFNGGAIAGSEYRIALALGAQVGIVVGTGRAADTLLTDPLWTEHPRLLRLHDPVDIARFAK